jgi:hypothetical protein
MEKYDEFAITEGYMHISFEKPDDKIFLHSISLALTNEVKKYILFFGYVPKQ